MFVATIGIVEVARCATFSVVALLIGLATAIRAADRCFIVCWSPGVAPGRHPIRQLVIVDVGEHHVFAASMCAGSACVHRINSISMSVRLCETCWMTMNASPPATSCFGGFAV
jgi:hypothetical protein